MAIDPNGSHGVPHDQNPVAPRFFYSVHVVPANHAHTDAVHFYRSERSERSFFGMNINPNPFERLNTLNILALFSIV